MGAAPAAVDLGSEIDLHHRERLRRGGRGRRDGRVYDTDRVMFLRGMLSQLQRATADGVPVDGYFYWSAQDNLEWNAGFGTRFGIIYVDFKTQKRTPKLSAQWFRRAALRNAVV